jgi:hypothetical protein
MALLAFKELARFGALATARLLSGTVSELGLQVRLSSLGEAKYVAEY